MTETQAIVKQEKSMRVGAGGVMPQTMDDVWRLSNAIAKSNTAPKGMTVEDIFIAVNYGLSMGLPWVMATSSIAVINGRPAIYGRALLGVIQASGLLEDVQESFDGKPCTDEFAAVCRVKRKDQPTWAERRFSIANARKAGLFGKAGPWTQHPEKMLMWRARGGAFGETFADVLCGLAVAEELYGDDRAPTEAAELEGVVVASENVEPPTPLPVGTTEQTAAWEREVEAAKPLDFDEIDAAADRPASELWSKP